MLVYLNLIHHPRLEAPPSQTYLTDLTFFVKTIKKQMQTKKQQHVFYGLCWVFFVFAMTKKKKQVILLLLLLLSCFRFSHNTNHLPLRTHLSINYNWKYPLVSSNQITCGFKTFEFSTHVYLWRQIL